MDKDESYEKLKSILEETLSQKTMVFVIPILDSFLKIFFKENKFELAAMILGKIEIISKDYETPYPPVRENDIENIKDTLAKVLKNKNEPTMMKGREMSDSELLQLIAQI
jgi:hypothetical protein